MSVRIIRKWGKWLGCILVAWQFFFLVSWHRRQIDNKSSSQENRDLPIKSSSGPRKNIRQSFSNEDLPKKNDNSHRDLQQTTKTQLSNYSSTGVNEMSTVSFDKPYLVYCIKPPQFILPIMKYFSIVRLVDGFGGIPTWNSTSFLVVDEEFNTYCGDDPYAKESFVRRLKSPFIDISNHKDELNGQWKHGVYWPNATTKNFMRVIRDRPAIIHARGEVFWRHAASPCNDVDFIFDRHRENPADDCLTIHYLQGVSSAYHRENPVLKEGELGSNATTAIYEGRIAHPHKPKENDVLQYDKFCSFLSRSDTNDLVGMFRTKNYDVDAIVRYKFFKQLSEYKPCESLSECPGNPYTSYKCFHNYKFHIVMENSMVNGYVSEKLFNGALGGGIPIYFGASDIDSYINAKSIVFCNVSRAVIEEMRQFYPRKSKATRSFLFNASSHRPTEQELLNWADEYLRGELEPCIRRVIDLDGDDVAYRNVLKEPFITNPEVMSGMYPYRGIELGYAALRNWEPFSSIQEGVDVAPLIDQIGTITLLDSKRERSIKSVHSLFHFIFTTAPESLTLRVQRAIEAVFYHHPNAKVMLHSCTLSAKGTILDSFSRAGYDLQIVNYTFTSLIEGSSAINSSEASEIIQLLPEFRKGRFWYSHETDFVRMLLMEKYGGVYLDTDMHFVKPLDSAIKNVVAWQDPNHGLINGALMVFEKDNKYLQVCLHRGLSKLLEGYEAERWSTYGPNLLTYTYRKWHKLSKGKVADIVNVVESYVFYPYHYNIIRECFQCDHAYKSPIDPESTIAVHLNTKATRTLGVEQDSICSHVLSDSCIFCENKIPLTPCTSVSTREETQVNKLNQSAHRRVTPVPGAEVDGFTEEERGVLRGRARQPSSSISSSQYAQLNQLSDVYLFVKEYFESSLSVTQKKILSFCSSTGEEAISLATLYFTEFSDATIYGFDNKHPTIYKAKQNVARRDELLPIHFFNMQEMPLNSAGSYDAIFANSVLCYRDHDAGFSSHDFEAALMELDSALKVGGLLAITNTSYSFDDTALSEQYETLAQCLAGSVSVDDANKNGCVWRKKMPFAAKNTLSNASRDQATAKKKMNIVGFWHIGRNYQESNLTRDEFVMKQGREILNSWLVGNGLSTGDYDLRLNYVTQCALSNETKRFLGQSGIIYEHPPRILNAREGEEYYEFPTLMELHSFCKSPENTGTIVFYVHSKTSDEHRLRYERYLLGNSCVRCLQDDQKLACGPRYTGNDGWYWKHFSGNFWMSRCSHIATLNEPFFPELLDDAKKDGMTSKEESSYWPPYGRLFAEYWLMNDSGRRPTEHTKSIAPGLIKKEQVCSDVFRYADNESGPTSTSDSLPDTLQSFTIEYEANSGGNLAIVSAFSENHQLEEVAMLRTLVSVRFKGQVYLYLMSQVGESSDWSSAFKKELAQSPLSIRFIDYEVPEPYSTYCFKSRVMSDFLLHNSQLELSRRAKVVMWSDASTRFMQDPALWSRRMLSDEVDFVSRYTSWNVPGQTHIKTFDFFGLRPSDFKDFPSISATHFLVNLERESIRKVLQKWVDCGVQQCQTCMAPLGSMKIDPRGKPYVEGSYHYVSHRQDQAVLALLVSNYTRTMSEKAKVNIIISDDEGVSRGTKMGFGYASPYFCVRTNRGKGGPIGLVRRLSDWKTSDKIPAKECQHIIDLNTPHHGHKNETSTSLTIITKEQSRTGPNFSCLGHLQSEMKGTQLKSYQAKVPILSSIVPTEDSQTIRVLFIMRHIRDQYKPWYDAVWKCSLTDEAVMLGIDPHSHTLSIECPRMVRLISVRDVEYNVPSDICPWIFRPAHLSACTMIKGSSAHAQIAVWAAYHLALGVEQIYVYINEDWAPQFQHESVHWIPFNDPFSRPFFVQQAMQNDCIARAKFQSKWVALMDVDEFFQPINPKHLLPDILEPFENTTIGGLQIRNWFFGSHSDETKNKNATNVIGRFVWRAPEPNIWGREKLIIQPTNVNYFSVHKITSGKDMSKLDVHKEIRLCHYKNPEEGVSGYDARDIVRDESMLVHLEQVQNRLDEMKFD